MIAESRFVSVFSKDSAAIINKNYKLELYAKSGSKDTKRSTESHYLLVSWDPEEVMLPLGGTQQNFIGGGSSPSSKIFFFKF